jgi:hypothetical protein
MAITYTLNVTQIMVAPQLDGETDVVVKVGWVYVGNDGTNTAAFGGSTDIVYDPKDPFVPYADLTPAEVEEWVLAAWPPEQLQAQQDAIAAQLATPALPLPWNPSA